MGGASANEQLRVRLEEQQRRHARQNADWESKSAKWRHDRQHLESEVGDASSKVRRIEVAYEADRRSWEEEKMQWERERLREKESYQARLKEAEGRLAKAEAGKTELLRLKGVVQAQVGVNSWEKGEAGGGGRFRYPPNSILLSFFPFFSPVGSAQGCRARGWGNV